MGDIGWYITSHRKTHAALTVFLSLLLILIASAAVVGGCGKKISLEYESAPDLAIVKAESDGGLPHPGDDLFPRFQLFGDGRVIKYQGEPNYRGIFVQGRLDERDIGVLLQRISDTGFFKLKDEYRNPNLTDATYSQISVDLVETEKTVRVWMMMNVREFDAAYDLIMDYPLGEVTEYVPEKGYLVVARYPMEAKENQNSLDPNSEIYQLLPDTATLIQAADSNTAVAVNGATFLKIKKYENEQERRGLYISQPDSVMMVYPVYEPRTAKKP
jgi:hypothetical protein